MKSKNNIQRIVKSLVLASTLGLSSVVSAGEVEVLHFWTSGGEAKSAAALKELLEAKGHQWRDFAVAGGGGDAAMTVLKSRAVAGNPPTAAQVKGPSIQEWGNEGVLANVSAVAAEGDWDNLLPSVVANVMKYEGDYVAAPVNVHRVNWLWANPAVFEQAGAALPNTWDEFFDAADKIKAAGLIPFAHGGQPWQDFTVFESIVLGTGGADLYNKVFVELDEASMKSDGMKKSFEILRRLNDYTDAGSPGRDWNVATGMVIEGKAAMQVMGDWAKGEFTNAGKMPGKDFVCMAAPGTADAFTFNIDSFIFFDQSDSGARDAQNALAATIMEPEFQQVFNVAKGSIPARLNMPREPFDACALTSMDDFVKTAETGGLVPSVAHGMAAYSAVAGAMSDVVTKFFNSDMSAEDAVAAYVTNVMEAKASL
ncbi:MAG: extracellular solute-binding protein [Gammaproteobacteria bacterium]|nr:extracellular solute-binding protein [Gammaproteobacteria bacterium]